MTRDPKSISSCRRALLIGINHYPFFLEQEQLEGCLNDVELAQSTLINRGFGPGEIQTLTNRAATRAAILEALAELDFFVQRSAARGKQPEVFVHYSGHGSYFQASNKDSLRSETLVPTDSGRRGHPNRDIKDTWIQEWLHRLAPSASRLTLVFDSCHSGSLSRNALGTRRRGLPPSDQAVVPAPRWLKSGRGAFDPTHSPIPWLLAAACRATESAHELAGASGEDPPFGAFSHHLYQTLGDAGIESTWSEVFAPVRLAVTGTYPSQHPQLEGDVHRRVAGQGSALVDPYLLVEGRNGDTVQLGGGAIHGLVRGAQWSIHDPQARRRDCQPIGLVEVTTTDAAQASAQLVEERQPGLVGTACRAFESQRPSSAYGLDVYVEKGASGSSRQDLLALIAKAPGVRTTDEPGTAEVQIVQLSGKDRFEASLGGVCPSPSDPYWLAVCPDETPLGAPKAMTDPAGLETLVENLVKRSRYQLMLHLAQNPGWALCDLEILVEAESGWGEPQRTEEGFVRFRVGDRMAFKITNRDSDSLFPYLFHLGDRGEVTLLDPTMGSHESLAPGKSRTVGEGRRKLTATFAQGRAEYVQLFLSTSELDLSCFRQQGYRGQAAARPEGSGLQHLLDLCWGDLEPANRRGINSIELQSWGTLVRPFRVDSV